MDALPSNYFRRPHLRSSILFLLVVTLVVTSAGLAVAASGAQSADDGKAIFQQKCAACHTIGGGDTLGPDLQGVTGQRDRGWLKRWIAAPEKMIAEKDPTAVQLLSKYNNLPMPNLGLSETQVDAVLAYLETPAGKAGQPAEAVSPLPQGDPVLGKDLFTGAVAFHNSGPSCLACHSVAGIGALGGGTLGPDLTDAYGKFKDALVTWPQNVAPMQAIYSEKPLTPEEQSHLLTFLGATAPTRPPEVVGLLAALALAGAAGLILLAHFLWRGRLGGVRRPMIIGPRRTSRTP